MVFDRQLAPEGDLLVEMAESYKFAVGCDLFTIIYQFVIRTSQQVMREITELKSLADFRRHCRCLQIKFIRILHQSYCRSQIIDGTRYAIGSLIYN